MNGQSATNAANALMATTVTGSTTLAFLEAHAGALGVLVAFTGLVCSIIFYICTYRIRKREAMEQSKRDLLTKMLIDATEPQRESLKGLARKYDSKDEPEKK